MYFNIFTRSKIAIHNVLKCSVASLHITSVQNAKRTFRFQTAYGEPPLHNEDKYIEAEEAGQLDKLAYAKIRFARLWENNSLFYDEDYERYIRRMMVNGRKGLMYNLLHDTCYEIKCRQYSKLRKIKEKNASNSTEKSSSKQDDEEKLEMDPIVLFHKALINCRPQVVTRKVKRGGATYQVPFPITSKESDWISMRWMNTTLKERARPRTKHYAEALADEVLAASKGQGKIVKMRDDLHRLAQANKAYSHYRWG